MRCSGQKAKVLSFLAVLEPNCAATSSSSESVPLQPRHFSVSMAPAPSVTPTKSSARRGKHALHDKVDTLLGSVTPLRPATAPSLNLLDQSPAAAQSGTASEAVLSAKKVQATAPAPSVTPTKSSARRGKHALHDKVDTLLGSVTPLRPATAPSLNLLDQSPAAAQSGTASEAVLSAKKVQATAAATVLQLSGGSCQSDTATCGAPMQTAGFRSQADSYVDLASSAALHAVYAAALPLQPPLSKIQAVPLDAQPHPVSTSEQLMRPAAEGGWKPQRVRQHSILHPDQPLLSAADVSRESDCTSPVHFDGNWCKSPSEGSAMFAQTATCDMQQPDTLQHAAFSMQSAADIASVFLEIVKSSAALPQKCDAMKEAASTCRPPHAVRARENKDSKKQLASIIKNKAHAHQPLQEYQAARFAKRMQLYNTPDLTNIHCAHRLTISQVCGAQQSTSGGGCGPQHNSGTFLKAVPSLLNSPFYFIAAATTVDLLSMSRGMRLRICDAGRVLVPERAGQYRHEKFSKT
jgi:hypothetical protein